MKFLKPYNHLLGYLHRFTFFKLWKFHFRIHHILSIDKTPFLHNHPFFYCSIIISGGYSEIYEKNEQLIFKKNSFLNIIFRKQSTYHRITHILPNTKTLFFTFKSNQKWNLKQHHLIPIPQNYWNPPDGLYQNIYTKEFRNRKNSIWLIKNNHINLAINEINPSIHQQLISNDWINISIKKF